MPTYQYRCKDCANDLEVVQKFTDASLTECPHCRGELRKVFNAVGVVFKGSGFYATDSRSKNTATTTPAASTSSDTATPAASPAATPAAAPPPASAPASSSSSSSSSTSSSTSA